MRIIMNLNKFVAILNIKLGNAGRNYYLTVNDYSNNWNIVNKKFQLCDETQIDMKYYFWQFFGRYIVVICNAERRYQLILKYHLK